jgi:hypothetical protein
MPTERWEIALFRNDAERSIEESLIRKTHFPYQSGSGDLQISFADNVSVLYVYVN